MIKHPVDATVQKFTNLANLVTKTSCFIGKVALLAVTDRNKLDQKITAFVQATATTLANASRYTIIEKTAEFGIGLIIDAYTPTLGAAALARIKSATQGLVQAAKLEEKVATIANKLPKPLRRAVMPVTSFVDDLGEIGKAAHTNGVQETITTLEAIEKDASIVAKEGSLTNAMARVGETTGAWCMPEKGTMINGRWYTQHALERMAPDTIEVRAILSQRAIKRGYLPETKEFIGYVNPRGIPPSVIEDTIKNGKRSIGRKLGTLEFENTDVMVITNADTGAVVTIFPKH